MLRTLSLFVFLAMAPWLGAETITRTLTINFQSDVHQLNATALSELQAFLSATDLTTEHQFQLNGHTDSEGDHGYNDALAEERTHSVKKWLMAQGVDENTITFQAFGKRRPLALNSTEEDKHQNRRVELVFKQYIFNDLSDVRESLRSENRTEFTIDGSKEELVQGKQGVRLKIPENCFTTADHDVVDGAITLELTEALLKTDFVAEELSTRSGNLPLVSGGMLKLEAFDQDGRPLTLSDSSSILLSIPAITNEPGMELFTSTDGADWATTGQQELSFSYQPSRRPFLPLPEYTAAKYQLDESAKPRRPSLPVRPHQPISPRKESYSTEIRWHQFMKKDQILARNAQRYQEAIERYDEKIALYDERLRKYHEDCKTYPKAKVNYELAYDEWQQAIVDEEVEFNQEAEDRSARQHAAETADARAKYEAEMDKWTEENDRKEAEYAKQMEALGMVAKGNSNQYVFATTNLGWINCDRFMEVPPQQKYIVRVEDTDETPEQVYLTFHNINSMMLLQKDRSGKYVAPNIPRNEPASIVAYKVGSGKVLLSKKPARPGATISLDYQESSLADLRMAFQRPGS